MDIQTTISIIALLIAIPAATYFSIKTFQEVKKWRK